MRLTSVMFFALAVAATLSACGTSPYVPEKKFKGAAEMRLERLSGSRIPQMVDMNDAVPSVRLPLTIITRDQIDANGASSVSELLGNFSFDYSGGTSSGR